MGEPCRQVINHFACVVSAGIVHKDDLSCDRLSIEHLPKALDQLGQITFFVVAGNNYRKLVGVGHVISSTKSIQMFLANPGQAALMLQTPISAWSCSFPQHVSYHGWDPEARMSRRAQRAPQSSWL